MCIGNRVQWLPMVVDTFNCTMYKRHDFVLFLLVFCFDFSMTGQSPMTQRYSISKGIKRRKTIMFHMRQETDAHVLFACNKVIFSRDEAKWFL